MFAKANAEVGPVDILVNNAGITKVRLPPPSPRVCEDKIHSLVI